MRRQLLKETRGVAAQVQRQFTTTSRAPFVCANCRRAALHRSNVQQRPSQRSFGTSARPRQQAATIEAQPPQQASIPPQTHYDIFPNTFPNGPPPNSPFIPDLRQLRKEFLQLQSKAHPDLARPGQKRQAEALSMRVNEAYKVLQDPLKRAQYLLSLRGIDVEDDSAKLSENELLMEVMAAREAVEEVENEDQLVDIRNENTEKIDESVEVLDEAFAKDDMGTAANEAVRLRYWMNIEESIQGWEKGKGGGLVHH